jgi:hypothetical protein
MIFQAEANIMVANTPAPRGVVSAYQREMSIAWATLLRE